MINLNEFNRLFEALEAKGECEPALDELIDLAAKHGIQISDELKFDINYEVRRMAAFRYYCSIRNIKI